MFRLEKTSWRQHSGLVRKSFLTIVFAGLSVSMLLAQDHYHHLIMGSYKTFEKATEAMPTIMETTGRQPTVLFPQASSDWFRISAYQSVNRAEVEGFSREMARNGKPKGWILTLAPVTRSTMRNSPQGLQQNSNQRIAGTSIAAAQNGDARYHLIVGSFQTYEKASEALVEYEDKGLEPYIVFPVGEVKAYRISVYVADNREEVASYSNMLSRSGMQKGWIFEEAGTTTSQSPLAGNTRSNARLASANTSATTGAVYHLIGGSFKRYDDATSYMDAARTFGGVPQILWPEDGEQENFRVSIISSSNRSEVEAFKRQLEARGLQAGWILAKS